MIHTFSNDMLKLKKLGQMLNDRAGGSHCVKKISGASNNCWWRATWVSILLRYASLGGSPNQLEEILGKKLGTSFRSDAKRITTMIKAIQEKGGNGVAEILTEKGRLKLHGFTDEQGIVIAEEIFQRLTSALLLSEGLPLAFFEDSVNSHEMGDEIMAGTLCRGLNSDMVIFNGSQSLAVCAQKKSRFRSIQLNDAGRQSLSIEVINEALKKNLTAEVMKVLVDVPVLMRYGEHYEVSVPNKFVKTTR